MRKVFFAVFLSICSINIKALSADNFNFHFDYCVFRDENSKVLVELYYSFDQNELLFVKNGSGFEASGRIKLNIQNKTSGSSVVLKEFKIPVEVTDTVNYDKNLKLTGQINILLDTGAYVFKVRGTDFYDSAKTEEYNEEVVLENFPDGKLNLSTIQLSTNISKSTDQENLFYKNTLEVIPNPSLLFGNNLSKLYYYVELYNLKKEILGDKYSVVTTVANIDWSEIKSETKSYVVKTDSKVEFGSIDVKELPSKKYVLIIRLLDANDKEMIRASKYFYIYNSSIEVTTDNSKLENDYLLSEYPKMKEEEVDDEYNKAIYLMPYNQKMKYESLKNIDEKKRFMFAFWTAMNSVIKKSEYYERIKFSNRNFKSDYKEGWKTDRGRVYCIYGKYDEIERFPYEGATRAYEIWNYNKLQGGVIFVFIDMSAGYGDYVQVHSTAQNEMADYTWRDKLNVR
jgi:GWxTD domain-containing protein